MGRGNEKCIHNFSWKMKGSVTCILEKHCVKMIQLAHGTIHGQAFMNYAIKLPVPWKKISRLSASQEELSSM
jgi:hypothetical protein